MSIPILPGHYEYEQSYYLLRKYVPSISISLDDVLSNLATISPISKQDFNKSYPGIWRPDAWRISFDIWSTQLYNFKNRGLCELLYADPPNVWYSGSGATELSVPDLWKDELLFQYCLGDAAVLPVLPIADLAATLPEAFDVRSKAIGMSLECVSLHSHSDNVVVSIRDDMSINLQVFDPDGCMADFSLKGQRINNQSRPPGRHRKGHVDV